MPKQRKEYKSLASDIIRLVGGRENIDKIIHCVTRLRFYLKDNTIADKDKLQDLDGVMGVVESGGQYQVIVGEAVGDIYKEVDSELNLSEADVDQDIPEPSSFKNLSASAKAKHAFNSLIGVITASMMPIISILAASGIIKSILTILTVTTNLVSTEGSIYLIINAMADSVFFFLPIMIGFNAAKRLDSNPILTAVIAGVLVHPSILEAANSGRNILSMGSLNFPFVSYTYSIFPMILAAWFVKKIEAWLKKRVPIYLQSIFVPAIVIGIVSFITFLITGPVIMWISLGLAVGLEKLITLSAPIFGAIVDGFYQILVIFGLHWGLIHIYVNDFATQGYSYFSAMVSVTIVAQGGAALAVAVKSKNRKIKQLAYAGALSAFSGITEPAIYGINLRFRKPFICASIASAVGGFLTGIFKINMWNIIGSLIGLSSFIDPVNGITSNFWYAVLVTLVTIFLAFILTYIWGYNDDMEMQVERKPAENPAKRYI